LPQEVAEAKVSKPNYLELQPVQSSFISC